MIVGGSEGRAVCQHPHHEGGGMRIMALKPFVERRGLLSIPVDVRPVEPNLRTLKRRLEQLGLGRHQPQCGRPVRAETYVATPEQTAAIRDALGPGA
jgi:hypothetical protein